VPITPDTKDWTWVLERVCPECGFDVRSYPKETTGRQIRVNASRWPELLAHSSVRQRPAENVWSGLEYACHVRDVYGLYDRRLVMMLEQDDPLYPNWDQDETAVAERYDEQDPDRVATELVEAANRLAGRFDALSPDEWQRTGTRSDGARFTVETFARYLLHDPVHHVNDVERGYGELATRDP
jgi:DinB superfamily